jgi:hypothetical protein
MYKVDTRSVVSEVSFGSGARVVGEMFLRPSFVTATGLESVADRLNDRDAFFPLRVSGAEAGTHFIGKAQVRYVISELEPEPLLIPLGESSDSVEFKLRIELDDGEEIVGLLRAVLPRGKRRALDLINEHEGNFVPFIVAERQFVIQRQFIRRLRDEAR